MTNCFFHLSCLRFLCWMADTVLGLSDSAGWVKLDSVCFLWQKSLHAVRRYAVLISYGCLKEKKNLFVMPTEKAWLSPDQNFSISLWVFLSPNLEKQQRDFGKIRKLVQELWLGTVPWKGTRIASPECYSWTLQELRTDDGENADVLLTEITDRYSRSDVWPEMYGLQIYSG